MQMYKSCKMLQAYKNTSFIRFFFLVLTTLALQTGCSQLRSHDELMSPVIAARNNQGVNVALNQLREALSKSEQNELLYALELGELLRENEEYEASTQVWLHANELVLEWEKTALSTPHKLLAYLGASTISERLKPYEGQDYEKTWLTTRIALNHIALGDWEAARVDIKRTHEREAIIANFRREELSQVRREARNNGWSLRGGDLSGYPVEYIDAPEVLQLLNSYQNAFSHYLAGYLYEVLNEPSLAAPGYRKAIELKPDLFILEEGLRGLEERLRNTHQRHINETDVLFIVESGDAPVRRPFEASLPVPIRDGSGNTVFVYVSVAFPIIRPVRVPDSGHIELGEHFLTTDPIVDLNAMARRALRDEMPGLIFRGFSRAASKGALQYYANTEGNEWVGLLASIFSVTTEQADDRLWRTLPGAVSIARGYIPPGNYPLVVNGVNTGKTIDIQGQYAVVPIRLTGRQILVGRTASYGQLPQRPPAKTEDAEDK